MTTGQDAGLGHLVVQLTEDTDLGRLRSRTADVLLAVLTGEIEIVCDRDPPRTLYWGQAASFARGRSWSARAPRGPARVLVVAAPPGPEGVVAALCADPPLRPRTRLSVALEGGVELLL